MDRQHGAKTLSIKRAIVAVSVLSGTRVFGHTGEALEPHDLWAAWSFDPGIVLPILVSGALYAIGARRSPGLRTWEKTCFALGWLTLALALVSPVHPLGEALFSAHMTQHELLMIVAAPLLVLGRPMIPFLWGLPFEWRRTAGSLAKAAPVQYVWRATN